MPGINPGTTRYATFALLLAKLLVIFTLSACTIPGFGGDDEHEPFVSESDADPTPIASDRSSPESPETRDDSSNGDAEELPTDEPITLTEAGLQEPRTLNPVLVGDPISEEISTLVFSGLVRLDPQSGEPLPDLAENWEFSDDGTSVTFLLREDIYWHDGQPVTAQDVRFTYQLMMDERARSPRYARLVERITAVEALSERRVEFRLAAPYSPFLVTLATFGIVPQHVLQDVLPEELVTDPFGVSVAIGSGPFQLETWQRGERILFNANPNYHHGAPVIDSYQYRVALDDSEIIEGIQEGSIDWARVSPQLVTEIDEENDVTIHSIQGYELIAVFLQLDLNESELFADHRIREALIRAIDRDAILEEYLHGHGQVADGTLPPGSWAHRSADIDYAHDPARAGELLTEAGWATSDDGIRMRNGVPLQFRLITNGDNPLRRELALEIVQQWREVGIDAHASFETWADVRSRMTSTREFETLLVGIRWDVDPDQHAFWSSDSIQDAFNIGSYVNLEVDALLDEALINHDAGERSGLYAEAQERIMQDLPILPIVFPNLTIVTGPALHGADVPAILVRNRASIAELVPVTTDQRDDSEN